MWSFRPKVDSREVASPGLVKVDSTDDKLYSTTPLTKDAFYLDYFSRHYLNRSSLLHDLRNLDNCYVDLEYGLYKVITAKCCGSLYAVTFTLTLIP